MDRQIVSRQRPKGPQEFAHSIAQDLKLQLLRKFKLDFSVEQPIDSSKTDVRGQGLVSLFNPKALQVPSKGLRQIYNEHVKMRGFVLVPEAPSVSISVHQKQGGGFKMSVHVFMDLFPVRRRPFSFLRRSTSYHLSKLAFGVFERHVDEGIIEYGCRFHRTKKLAR